MRGTKLNLKTLYRSQIKISKTQPQSKKWPGKRVMQKAYHKYLSWLKLVRYIHFLFVDRMNVLSKEMSVFRTNIHFGLCTTLPDHDSNRYYLKLHCHKIKENSLV